MGGARAGSVRHVILACGCTVLAATGGQQDGGVHYLLGVVP